MVNPTKLTGVVGHAAQAGRGWQRGDQCLAQHRVESPGRDVSERGGHVPSACFRLLFAVRREETVKTLPSVVGPGEWLPKEQWTAHQCLLERDQGFKTLIGVRQTGERDIQPRLVEALEAAACGPAFCAPHWPRPNAPPGSKTMRTSSMCC